MSGSISDHPTSCAIRRTAALSTCRAPLYTVDSEARRIATQSAGLRLSIKVSRK
jgi:hypothetical protein